MRVKFKWGILFFLYLLSFEHVFNLGVVAAAASDFERLPWNESSWNWLDPESIKERVVGEREILVRTRNRESRTEFQGLGSVGVSCEKAFAQVQRYEEWVEATSVLESVQWDAPQKLLLLQFNVLGLKAPIKARIETEQSSEEKWLHARVEEGYFAGVTSALRFTSSDAKTCTVEVRGRTLPDKSIGSLIQIALEQVMYTASKKMRNYVERKSK